MQQVVKFDPKIVEACKIYSDTISMSEQADSASSLSHWHRAAAAFEVKQVCDTLNVPYISPAMKLCNVERSTIVMELKAETIRRDLKLNAEDLPSNSLSAFYELHRAKEIGHTLTGGNAAERKKFEKKLAGVGKQIAENGLSVRAVRKAFSDELSRAKKARRSKRALPATIAKPPSIKRVSADELKALVEQVVVPAGLSVPLVTVIPNDATAQAIEAYFADPKFRQTIADSCPTKGALWILIDLKSAEHESAESAKPKAVQAGKKRAA